MKITKFFIFLMFVACADQAQAACGKNDQVFIDPRLIKVPPGYTPEQLQAVMSNPWASERARDEAYQSMLHSGDPIKMPYGSGYVLIDPLNPCVQQYIPVR